jgi:hypothetical protein
MSITPPLLEQLYLAKVLRQNPLAIDPHYLSFRPDLLSTLAKGFEPMISSLHYDFIYPLELFSVALATHLSLIYNIPLFLSSKAEAFMQSGQTALVLSVSDPLSSGLAACVEAFKNRDLFVSDALTLLEPTAEDKKTSQNSGVVLHSLWDIKTLQNDLNTLLHQNSYSKIHSSAIS